MAFKLSLVGDVRAWLRATDDVEESLGDIADSLDDLARETLQSADKAATGLEREFKDAFDDVRTDAKKTGRKIEDEMRTGTRGAGEGIKGLKEEASGGARELAASFTGSAEEISGSFQEVIAQAGASFGPYGLLAGVVAAGALGVITQHLVDQAEKAAALKEEIGELAQEINDAGDKLSEIDLEGKIRDFLNAESGTGGLSNMELFVKVIPEVDPNVLGKALLGDPEALDSVGKSIGKRVAVATQEAVSAGDAFAGIPAELQAVIDKMKTPAVPLQAAIDQNAMLDDFTRGVKASQAASTLFLQDNPIKPTFRFDEFELQRQVNQAAASITAPTIYANVKARKETP